MDDSPFRVKKRRGEGKSSTAEDKENELDPEAEDDDEIGETPLKGAAFGLLDDALSKPRDLFPIFQKAMGAPVTMAKPTSREPPKPSPPAPSSPRAAAEALRVPTPEPELPSALDKSTAAATAVSSQSRCRVMVLSDDDEWDPESDKRVVKITGTRRPTVRGQWSDDDFMDPAPQRADKEEEEEGSDDCAFHEVDLTETRSLASLSIRSPATRKGERMDDLRVRALLDPTSAAATALRALTKGQEVFVSGEGTEGDEEDAIDSVIQIGEGDDDWESDPEGWKAVVSDEEW